MSGAARGEQGPAARAAGLAALGLPEGEYTLSRASHDALVRASGALPDRWPDPHPILASTATLAATGLGIAELCRIAGWAIEAGPMLGECRLDFRGRLRFDVRYRVTRQLLSLERKASARFGAMDRLRFVATLHDPEHGAVAAVTYTWLLPRRDAA